MNKQKGEDKMLKMAKHESSNTWPHKIKIIWIVTLLLVCGLIAIYILEFTRKISFRSSFIYNLILLSALLLALCVAVDGARFWPRKMFENKWQLLFFLMVLILGIFTRTVRFDVFPPPNGEAVEEAQMGSEAYLYYSGHDLQRFWPFDHLIAETGLKVFGSSMRGLRLPFLIASILSIPLFFLAARLFLKTYFAAISATLLYASSAHLSGVARIAVETFTPIFTLCLALAATFYACTKRSYASFALAGFANGLLTTEYFSYKLAPVLFTLFIVIYFLQQPKVTFCNAPAKRFSIKNLLPQLPKFIIFFLFALAPILPIILADPAYAVSTYMEAFQRHKSAMGRDNINLFLNPENLGKIETVASFLFVSTNSNYQMGYPVMEYFTGILAIMALVYCAIGAKRNPAKLFLTISFLLMVILSGILVVNPAAYRLIPVVPFCLLAIGVLIDDMCAGTKHKKQMAIVFSLVLLSLVLLNLWNFFMVLRNDKIIQDNFYSIKTILATEIASLQKENPAEMVYLLSNFDFLGSPRNDYAWLYDVNKVKVVATTDQLKNASHGALLSHNEFIPLAKSFNGTTDCSQWKAARDELLYCRIK